MIDAKKYSFRVFSKKYKTYFNKENCKLKKILPFAKIEHVGSSAVRGLGGKGIIDILISVPIKKLNLSIKKIQLLKYEFKPKSGSKERKFFQKIIKYNKKERRVHLHLTNNNSKTARSMIAVRNYLKENPTSLKEYEKVKKKAVKFAKGNGKKYLKCKSVFLKKIEKKSLKLL